ncbi:MAG: DUF1385 domain-containing protein [Clostridia bacterium]|nr:DUF1385 domain-containing protein [Clostridia bacterium]
MYLAEARAHSQGIDFYVPEKNMTISAIRRPQNSQVEVVRTKGVKHHKSYALKNDIKFRLLLFFICIVFASILNALSVWKSENWFISAIIVIAFIWVMMIIYYRSEANNEDCFWEHRYHAAEHKVLNYIDKFDKAPESVEDIMQMPNLSVRCGSTVIVFLLLLVTLCILCIGLLPGFILKALGMIMSLIISIYLWGTDRLYFFQKCVIKNPGYAEMEVAVIAAQEYMKLKNEN